MIKYHFFTIAQVMLCLIITASSKHGSLDAKKKDQRSNVKKLIMNYPVSRQRSINPEMLILTGTQKNDLNVIPLNVDAPKEAFLSHSNEKPIVISVSNDKQILSEENRMLKKPILVDGNLTNSEFFREFWSRLNATTCSADGLLPTGLSTTQHSREPLTEKERGLTELGLMKQNEIKTALAAINPIKDFDMLNDFQTQDPVEKNFNQTLSSDQLLCIIYKLLSMYKPSFSGNCPAAAYRPKLPKLNTNQPLYMLWTPTMKPIDNILYHLQVSKNCSNPISYRSPWNYQSSPPTDVGFDTATISVQKKPDQLYYDGSVLVHRPGSILDTLPLVKTFNDYNPMPILTIDKKISEPISSPLSSLRNPSSQDLKNRRSYCKNSELANIKLPINHQNLESPNDLTALFNGYNTLQVNTSLHDQVNKNIDYKGQNDLIRQLSQINSNASIKKSFDYSPHNPIEISEGAENFYSKILKQLQKESDSANGVPFSNDHRKLDIMETSTSLERISNGRLTQSENKNHNHPMNVLSPTENNFLTNQRHFNYLELLKNTKINPATKYRELHLYNKPVSSYTSNLIKTGKKDTPSRLDQNYFTNGNKEKVPETFSSDILTPYLTETSKVRKKEKLGDEKKRKKIQVAIRKKAKDERRKKVDFDILELLSQSMMRESKNFEKKV